MINKIPSMISKWLSDLSNYNEHFDKAAPIYIEALKNSSFNEPIKFLPTIPTASLRETKMFGSTLHLQAMLEKM